jgi:hypothetical protein
MSRLHPPIAWYLDWWQSSHYQGGEAGTGISYTALSYYHQQCTKYSLSYTQNWSFLHIQGHKIYSKHTLINLYPTPFLITTHPKSILYFPYWCTGPELFVTRTACLINWNFWRSLPGKMARASGRLSGLSLLLWGLLHPIANWIQSLFFAWLTL